MDIQEVEKSKIFITHEMIDYVQNAVVIKTILKKLTGNIHLMAVDKGEGLNEKSSPFDTFVEVIDGQAHIVINGESIFLKTGQSILIPAHAFYLLKPFERFKMLLTIIKSGYE
jgi:quercetin dioxygenase-like cupin family protein